MPQLLRIEREGAFAGLVGGSPAVARAQPRQSRRGPVEDVDARDARFVTELVAGACKASSDDQYCRACKSLGVLIREPACRGHAVAQAPGLAHQAAQADGGP
jgi:hypothetical protein